MELTDLAQYGSVGIAIALIGMVIYLGRIILNIFKNHLEHFGGSLDRNTEALEKIKDVIVKCHNN